MSGEIQLRITKLKEKYKVLGTPQQAYVYFEIVPAQPSPTVGRQPVNLTLVLDRSGSMAGAKLDNLKNAAKSIVGQLNAQDILSIVTFDDRAEIVASADYVTDQAQLNQKIDFIDERGGTAMSTGMQSGLTELQKHLGPDKVNRMILLTDGQTWEDKPLCEQLADQCGASGISMAVLGLGIGGEANWDPVFLENIAQRTGGDWTPVSDPAQLQTAFADILRDAQMTAISNASLTIRYVEDVFPKNVWRVVPLIARLGQRNIGQFDSQVQLGDVNADTGQSALAEVHIPAKNAGNWRLMQVDITYDVPANGLTQQKISENIVFEFGEADVFSADEPRLRNIIERVQAHKMQTIALDKAKQGDVGAATVRLRGAATRLLSLGETEMAQDLNAQADQLDVNGQLTTGAEQQGRFNTKRLGVQTVRLSDPDA